MPPFAAAEGKEGVAREAKEGVLGVGIQEVFE